jgi:hypothetical protein
MTQFRSSRLLSLFTAVAVAAGPAMAAPAPSNLPPPPAAKPGECYGRVLQPATYGTETRKVLVRPASTETRAAAATTQKVKKRVLVTPARTERVKVAPVYKDVVRVVYTPGKTKLVRQHARYEIVQEKVLIEPAHAEWQRVDAPLAAGGSRYPGQTMVEPTGEVLCRVWVPARYGYVDRKVLVEPSRLVEVRGPDRKQKIVVRKLVRAGGLKTRKIPAVYRTEWTTVSKPARNVVVKTPAVYRTEKVNKVVRQGGLGWERVFCGGQLDAGFMAKVQAALASRGYDAGPADGQARPETYAALRRFQAANGLSQGQLTIESARALGVW